MESNTRALLALVLLPSLAVATPARTSALAAEASRVAALAPGAGDDLCALDALEDTPLAPHRAQLLDQAFEAASGVPRVPHAKTRARLQEQVLSAWIELGQERRALAAIERIEGWRKAAAQADLAFDCARSGKIAAARALLDLAERTLAHEAGTGADWRQERVQAKIARTWLSLGDREAAAVRSLGVSEAEAGAIGVERAMRLDPKEFEAQIESLEQIAARGGFEEARNALAIAARLFDGFYEDAARRERILAAIERTWTRSPLSIRVSTTLELAGSALARGDRADALGFVAKAREMIDVASSTPDLSIPLAMQVAAVRARAGEIEGAKADAEAALRAFDAAGERILDIDRSDVLRSIAGAQAVIGDETASLSTWRRAAGAAVQNPNSRPRAEDLVATCVQLATSGVEPDPALRGRIAELLRGLGDPW